MAYAVMERNGMEGGKTSRPIFAIVVVSFLLSTIVSLGSLHIMTQRNVRDMNKVLATQIYDHIVGELTEPITVAKTMAHNNFLSTTLKKDEAASQDSAEQELADYLLGIERGLGYQSAFAISDSTLRYYTSRGYSRTVDPADEHDQWYKTLMESDDLYDLDVDSDEVDSKDLTVYVNAKVQGEGKDPVGLCGVGVRMTGIQELFGMLEKDFNVKIDLVDPEGLVQVDTNANEIEKANLHDLIKDNKDSDYRYTELGSGKFAITKYIEAMDWYLVVQSTGTNEAKQFAYVIMLNAALCIAVLVIMLLAIRHNRRRNKELANASKVDHLTMLYNRRAFEEDKDALAKSGSNENLVCVIVDVNGLKTANDTLGHEAGDELIRGAAECLNRCLGIYGKAYRTGGDEFAALIHVSEDGLERIKKDLEQTVDAWSGNKVKSLSMSCGYASSREFPQESVQDLCRIADKRMYEDKTRYYERTGADRRRT